MKFTLHSYQHSVDKSGCDRSVPMTVNSVTVLVIISTRTQLERSGEPPPVCFNYVEIAAALPATAARAPSMPRLIHFYCKLQTIDGKKK